MNDCEGVLPRLKYPKLLLLLSTFVAAYVLFRQRDFLPFHNLILSLGYSGTFLAGFFFVYGFTAAPATAVLLMLTKEQNILGAGFIAGFGALVGDLLLFKFIRHSFSCEIERLSKERMVIFASGRVPGAIKRYVIPILAGFIIASPLPDEIGVSLFAASRQISIRVLSVVSYLLNTAGIFVILTIGSLI
jgi:hypothetical protein